MGTVAWDRRSVLRLAAVGGLATGLAGRAALPAEARGRTFDLAGPARTLYTGAELPSVTVQQSISFDAAGDRLFVAQLRSGSPGAAGDLQIHEVTRNGAVLGTMTLLGHGHGVSFATETVRGRLLLWTEGDARDNGYGTVLNRFTWHAGRTLERDDSRQQTFLPVPEGIECTCDIDHRHRRMAVRYHTTAGKRIAIMDLDQVARGEAPDRLADFPQPEMGTFQGYALHGDDLYTIDGNNYSDTNPLPGNTYLSRIDWRTGELQERVLNQTAAELEFREPEGIAIGGALSKRPRLYFGFASEGSGARRSNVFVLNR